MAATIEIKRWTGSSGSPTKTDITGINTRVNAEDAHSTGSTTNPVAIPAGGLTNYSFWCVTRLHCTDADGKTINNIKWFTDGSNPDVTKIDFVVNTATTYIQASGSVGTTGDVLNTTNYSTLAGSPTTANDYISSALLTVAGSTTIAEDFGDFIVTQFQVKSTAGAGSTWQTICSWRWDEA